MKKILAIVILVFLFNDNAYSLTDCKGNDEKKWTNCKGTFDDGQKIYEGEWKNGKKEGEGYTRYKEDGSFHYGKYKNNYANDIGISVIEMNNYYSQYNGEWKDGKPNGQGNLECLAYKDTPKEIKIDEKNYSGEWKDGILTIKKNNQNNELILVGVQECGYWEGIGKIINSRISGEGEMTYPDGFKYAGKWVDDKLDGKVIVSIRDGRTQTRIYVKGKKIDVIE